MALDELDAAAALIASCGLVPEDEAREELSAYRRADPDLVVVAHQERKLIGVGIGCYDGYRGTLRRLAVEPAHRNHGVGTMIALLLEQELADRGARKLRLHVRSDDGEARLFWEARGYSVVPAIYLGKNAIRMSQS
jgi:ribosomal protein S18 acetylase RimI-like enzyme